MFLLGLLIWIAVSGGLAWLIARLLTRRSSKPWLRPLLAILLLPPIFMAPLADEIIGKFQFDRLCEEAKEVKIYATHPVGEELYTPEGKWRVGNTLEERNRLSAIFESLLRWDSGPSTPEVIPGAIPIRRYQTKIYDRTDGRLLAEFVGYGTSGGWLGRSLGGPVLTSSACSPQLVEKGDLKDQIIPFKKSSGETK
jgi:hypothetical protein